MYVHLDKYTAVFFEDKQPKCVYWELSTLGSNLDDEKLIKDVKSKLMLMGWDVEIENPEFGHGTGYYAAIKVVE